MEYSVVIPCYRSARTITAVVKLLGDVFKDIEYEIILVNDGSPDGGETKRVLHQLASGDEHIVFIDLAKNAGQHNAILCGLSHVRGNYVICMDDDLQTHPDQIYRLREKIAEGYDIVYACYPQKKHSAFRNLGSAFSSWTVRVLIGKPRDLRTSSFWIARRFVADEISAYPGAGVFLPALVLRTTDNIGSVEVEHHERAAGESGYTLKKLIKLWSNACGYSVLPLRLILITGVVCAAAGLAGICALIIQALIFGAGVPGIVPVLITELLFSGIILMALGLTGEYVGRILLAAGNQPRYVIRNIEGGEQLEKTDDPGSGNIPGAADKKSPRDGD